MRKRELTALTLAAVMTGAFLTGCGGKAETSESTDVKTEHADAKSTEGADTSKTVVNIWSATFDTEAEQAAFKEAFQKSEASKTIEVQFEEIPAGTNQEKSDALLTNLIGDGGIDIFDADVAQYFNFATKGMFENLEAYAKEDNYDFDQLGADNVELSRINGDLYALPYVQSVWQMYYNKNIFDEAGIPYPTDDMTWNEFREVAKQLTKGEGAEKQWGFTMPDWPCTWTGIASQKGKVFVKEDGTINLDDPAFREALQFKYDLTMVDKSGPSLAENKVTKAHYAKQFSAGNIGMMIAGDWVHNNIKENLGGNYTFEYDVAAMPHAEGAEAGTTYGAPRYTGINAKRSEEQKKASWEVLKFMTTPEVSKILVEIAGTLPAVVTDEIKESYAAGLPEFVTNGTVIFNPHKHVEEKAYHMAAGQIDQVLKEESELFLTDSQDLDKTMENIVRRCNDEIKIAVEAAK